MSTENTGPVQTTDSSVLTAAIVPDGPVGKQKRKRVERACVGCRQRRAKCDGKPRCAICLQHDETCFYPPPTRRVTVKYVEELERQLAQATNEPQQAAQLSGISSIGTPSSGISSSSTAPMHPSASAAYHPSSYPTGASLQSINPFEQRDQSSFGIGIHDQPDMSSYQPDRARSSFETDQRKSSNDSSFGINSQLHLPQSYEQKQQQQQQQHESQNRYHSNIQPSNNSIYNSSSNVPSDPFRRSDNSSSHRYNFGHPSPFYHSYSQSTIKPDPNDFQPNPNNVVDEPGHPVIFDVEEASDYTEEESEDENQTESGKVGTGSETGIRKMISLHPPRLRWERAGNDGHTTEIVESAAARLTGQRAKPTRQPIRGRPSDGFLTQAQTPSPAYDEMFELPEPALADDLLDFYEEHIHWLFPIIHFRTFRSKYSTLRRQPLREASTAADHIYLASLNLIFCLTCAIRSRAGDMERAGVCFNNSQALMSTTHGLLNVDILVNTVWREAYLILSLFNNHYCSCSKGNLAANASGLALLMARGLQLNDPAVNKTFDTMERCIRQRVWAGCIQMEATSSVMLYRPTSSSAVDFDSLMTPDLLDDDAMLVPPEGDRLEIPKTQFFFETIKLFSVKNKILTRLYNLEHPPFFPDTSQVLDLEEELLKWRESLPEGLKDKDKCPFDAIYQKQKLILTCRYLNVQILVYRPFLFYFCTTPEGSYPVPASLKFLMARKSAAVCADSAIKLIDLISANWKTQLLGFWWLNVGYLYSSALIVLAQRIVEYSHGIEPDKASSDRSYKSAQQVFTCLQELGWRSSDGFNTNGRQEVFPPNAVIKTARRCYRILCNIEACIKDPWKKEGSIKDKDDQEKHRHSLTNSASTSDGVAPSRYARNPDLTIPPMRLAGGLPKSDDEAFVASWIGLMKPEIREESYLPEDYEPPHIPFDLSASNQNANPNRRMETSSSCQGWSSLLGTGYLSNFGINDFMDNDSNLDGLFP
ncbi:Zn(2)-C6 fungal-type DNA-binding domain [Phaffia rhodozyma]|uniref:Zn(2)-C6 fungal-type DNA-binding domain n=1 Tax=Phaffia rhodozyma TaxID=264483 RepID=A0A0F7SWE6_PHARH|nr:Zn(2)-C6 fungal-type DNA-binding domain [Phaffia rhodozyma]